MYPLKGIALSWIDDAFLLSRPHIARVSVIHDPNSVQKWKWPESGEKERIDKNYRSSWTREEK